LAVIFDILYLIKQDSAFAPAAYSDLACGEVGRLILVW
jgi:hypothetical protein